MTLEARVKRIVEKANLNGYNRYTDEAACSYWFGSQQYFDHDFAKAFFPTEKSLANVMLNDRSIPEWEYQLTELVLVSGDQLAKLDFLEQFV